MTQNHAVTWTNPGLSRVSLILYRVFLTLALVLSIPMTASAQSKGTFRAGINYPAGPPTVSSNTGFLFGGIVPFETHVADVDGDGKPDVLTAASCGFPQVATCPAPNFGSAYVIVAYLSKGDGTFQTGRISGGPAPALRSFAVGDFNGDGKPDVVTASDCLSDQDCSSGTIAVLLGNGDGTFTLLTSYNLGGIVGQASTLAVGDFNRDGKLDVAVGIECYDIPNNGCSVGAVSIFLGNSDGTLASPTPYLTGGNNALFPVVGDFNNDGNPDVIAGTHATPADPSHASITVLIGVGDGTFTKTETPLPFFGLAGLAAVDLDSDGKLDLAVTRNSSTIDVFPGSGDGTFQSPVSYPLGLGNGLTNGSPIVVVDMNGDGKPDLIVSGTLGGLNGAAVLLNDGIGGLTPSGSYTAGGWLFAPIDVADFDGDGRTDLIVVSGCAQDPQFNNNCPDGTLTPLLGNGDGTFRGARYLDTGAASGISTVGAAAAAADFNGDGLQDLIYPACSSADVCATSGFALLLADGTGGYGSPNLFTAPVSGARFLTVGDFNGDGKADVATFNSCDAACTGASSISVFLNGGNGTFQSPVVYASGGSSPFTMTTGDFNGDGKRDIAILQHCGTCNDGQDSLGVLLGNGDGTFQSVVTMLTGAANAAWWIAAADLNGDGKTDLVLVENTNSQSDPYAGVAQILLSNGDGTFTFGQTYPTDGGRAPFGGGQGMAVTTGDVNGDGKRDIVIGNLCEPVYRGQVAYDVNCANGAIGVLLGNGDGTFQVGQSQIVTDGNLWAISLADVNDDGKLDEIASTSTGVLVAFGNGAGTFQAPTIYAALQAIQNLQLALADLNNDGGLDIVQPGFNGQLAVLYNQGFTKQHPVITIKPAKLGFAGQAIGTTSAPKTVKVTNAGPGDLHITSVTTAGDFSASSACPAALAPGSSCKISVRFSPTGFGKLTGTLFLTDDAVNSPQSVPLTGLGPDYTVVMSPSAGTVARGQSTNSTVNVAPLFGFNQTVGLTCTSPKKLTCSVAPNSVTLDGTNTQSATLTVNTTNATPPGTYKVTVKSTSGVLKHNATFTVTVN